MTVSNMKTTLNSNIKDVWEIVTSLENYAWRSDISRIEIVNEKQFVEYTKDDYPTTFTPFVKGYLKKQQETYVNDLKKALCKQ